MLALGSSGASAQNVGANAQNLAALNVPAAVRTLDVDASARPLGTGQAFTANGRAQLTPAIATTQSVRSAQSVTVQLPASIDREAAWLYRSGWPVYALADRYAAGAPLGEEANCIATAVYFEARGESAEGQLAVAHVVMNRAASGKYPASWCAVVKQPAQFSFVRHGQFPWIDTNSTAWARAQGITRIALANAVPSVSSDVLWYHANYVAPSWGRRLSMVQKIGAHIFYRS